MLLSARRCGFGLRRPATSCALATSGAPPAAAAGCARGGREWWAAGGGVRHMSSHFPDDGVMAQHSMVLKAVTRDPLGGTRRSNKLRTEGMVPGVVYGKGLDGTAAKLMVAVPHKALEMEIKKMQDSFINVPYLLSIDGAAPEDAELVFAAGVVRNHLTDAITCVNWLRYRTGRPVSVPMRMVNQELSLSMRRGAWVHRVERRVEVLISSIDPSSIPKYIDVDLTGVKAGDKIDASYLRLPPGVSLFNPKKPFRNGRTMGTVVGKKLPMEADADDSDDDEAAAQ